VAHFSRFLRLRPGGGIIQTMDLKRFSKFLSLVLRHEPDKFGVVLDAAGWTPVDALLDACARHGHAIDRATLERAVAENDKKRFSFDDSGTRIRANHGHSVNIELGYEAAPPPAVLYHGTATRFAEAIRVEGLKKMARHHVHLSADEATARAVGQRHGKPTVLVIDAAAMARRTRARAVYLCSVLGAVSPEEARLPSQRLARPASSS